MHDTGYWIHDTGYMIQDTGYWIQDTGYRIQDTGYRILDTGDRILDAVYWLQDTGYQKFQEYFTPGKVGATGENIQPVLPGVSDKVGSKKDKILPVLKVSERISSKQSQIKDIRFPVFYIGVVDRGLGLLRL